MHRKASIPEISDYMNNFDLIKLSPEWVKFIPTNNISQELKDKGKGKDKELDTDDELLEPFRLQEKPKYLDNAVLIMKSFKHAGYC
ncbi:hypothetical protein OnM2_034087 [Erysiphe neolycopersici]|uniref:Uncharacterized protein n=1 Tax=Erysiphe neolycopersici TaxID=212602 RepID=A0A420HXS5_9PEZI|nr:hypothetical protein OnM2_034087 [Erysiphe neolycopersici]